MRVISVLIIWSLPLLQAGAYGQFPSHGRTAGVPKARARVARMVIHQARDLSFPDDPSSRTLGISPGDEEESVEDGFVGEGLLLSRLWRDLERGDLSSLGFALHDLHRFPTCPHPLRC